jgi:site-specific DNA-adenine methylase
LVNAAIAVSDLAEHFQEAELPQNESVVRPLVPLEPDERIEVWSQAPTDAQRKDVAALVKAHKIVGAFPLIGSKWKLSKVIAERAKEIKFDKYLEAFCGSAAVFFRLVDEGLVTKPGTVVLNDKNSLAVCLLRVIRNRPDEFQKKLMSVPYSREEFDKPEPPPDADEIDRAVFWAVKTHQGFAGYSIKNQIWSVDNATSNAGRQERWNKFKQQILPMGHILCQFAALECLDALKFIQKYTSRSDRHLLYVDAPYIGYEKIYPASFTEHEKLAEILAEAPAAGVLVTYYDHELLRELYPEKSWDWELFDRKTTCTADGSRPQRTEVLLTRKQRLNVAYAAPQIQKAIAPSQDSITQSQPSTQVKSKVESWVAQIRAECQPGEIQKIISLLQIE